MLEAKAYGKSGRVCNKILAPLPNRKTDPPLINTTLPPSGLHKYVCTQVCGCVREVEVKVGRLLLVTIYFKHAVYTALLIRMKIVFRTQFISH